MDSQLASLLKKYIENTINGLLHDSQKLSHILNYFTSKQQSQGIAAAKMIALLVEYSTSETLDELSKNQRLGDLLAKLLQYLASILNVPVPLSYLLNCNFQKFISECQKQFTDKNIKDLVFHCHGLYPPNDINGKGSIFSFHSQKKEPFEGNPNWMYSRYVLSTCYNLHKGEMSDSTNSEHLFGDSNFLNKLWATIYRYYTQIKLDSSLENISEIDDCFITWSRIDFQTFRKCISEMELTMPQQSKLLYFLVISVLGLPFCAIQKQSIKNIYSLFTNFAYCDINLQLITNVLFFRLTKKLNLLQLQQEVCIYGQKLIETGLTGSNLFLPLFYNTNQIVQKIINQNCSFTQLPLNESQKRQISHQLFQKCKLKRQNLNYLQIQHFRQIFSTQFWKQQSYLKYMLELMQANKLIFINKLMSLAYQTSIDLTSKQFELFLQAWKSYYTILNRDNLDYVSLQRVLAVTKYDLRKKYHFMIIPREIPEAVLKILLTYSQFFLAMKSKSQVKGNFQTLLNQFQENTLPELLILINQEQRNRFWKEWISVINGDEKFVESIINAAENSKQN